MCAHIIVRIARVTAVLDHKTTSLGDGVPAYAPDQFSTFAAEHRTKDQLDLPTRFTIGRHDERANERALVLSAVFVGGV